VAFLAEIDLASVEMVGWPQILNVALAQTLMTIID
jgi:hypothetical protein